MKTSSKNGDIMMDVRLPDEIHGFFQGNIGRSLIIKGHAGTGKTILSLTLLEEIGILENSFYISTRVSNQSLYSQFDWLKEVDIHESLIDASMDFLKNVYPQYQPYSYFSEGKVGEEKDVQKMESAMKLLQTFPKEGEKIELPEHVCRSNLLSLVEKDQVQELEEIYHRVDSRLPEQCTIIIDSLESILEKYNLDATELIKTLQKDLVEMSGVNLVIVLEAEESTHWDYLVDGVVTLRSGELDERRIRTMHLDKLRGIEIQRPVYLFTLTGGRFNYFSSFTQKVPGFQGKHPPIEDSLGTDYYDRDLFSSGSAMLDEVLGGGYRRNSLTLLEFEEGVPFSGQMYLFGPTMENFLSQGRGVLMMPSSGIGKTVVKNWTRKLFGKEKENQLKILDLESKGGDIDTNNLKDYEHLFNDAYKELRYYSEEPLLTICDWIKLEHSIGSDRMEHIDKTRVAKRLLDLMRKNSGLTIGLMGPGFVFAEKARYISDVYLKVMTKYNSLLVYGEKPDTSIYNLSLTEEEHPHARFLKLA